MESRTNDTMWAEDKKKFGWRKSDILVELGEVGSIKLKLNRHEHKLVGKPHHRHSPTTMPKLHQLDHKRAAYFNSGHEPCSVLQNCSIHRTGRRHVGALNGMRLGALLFNPSIYPLSVNNIVKHFGICKSTEKSYISWDRLPCSLLTAT